MTALAILAVGLAFALVAWDLGRRAFSASEWKRTAKASAKAALEASTSAASASARAAEATAVEARLKAVEERLAVADGFGFGVGRQR